MQLFNKDFDRTLILLIVSGLLGLVLWLEAKGDATAGLSGTLQVLLHTFGIIVAFNYGAKSTESNGDTQAPKLETEEAKPIAKPNRKPFRRVD